MITYEPFYKTLRERDFTEYYLIRYFGISANILHRMKHGKGITTKTLDELCHVLHCNPEDIIQYRPD